MKRKLSRRNFLKAALLVPGGSAVIGCAKWIGEAPAKALSFSGLQQIFLPSVLRYEPTEAPAPIGWGKVVHVHANNAHNWTSGNDYWNYVNQGVVDQMVDKGMMNLTGRTSVDSAWRALLPNYKAGEIVAIKISLNNCKNTVGSTLIDAVPEPVNAIIRGLKTVGVADKDIWIYDSIRYIPIRFRDRLSSSTVTLKDVANNPVDGWPKEYIYFHPPGYTSDYPRLLINPVLTQTTYLINMPIMKRHGMGDQVSLSFKNHFGSVEKPMPLHIWTNPTEPGTQYSPAYSPYIEIYQDPKVAKKTILTVGDALFAAKDHAGEPVPWKTFGNQTPKSLFFATDPVAIDCVMADFCVAEMPAGVSYFQVVPSSGDYLVLAGKANLGVHERGDPWTNNYRTIRYNKITL